MLRRELSELGLLEAFASIVAVAMIAAIILVDQGRENYVFGAILSIGGVVACEVERAHRRRGQATNEQPAAQAASSLRGIRYSVREAILAAVFVTMVFGLVLGDGRSRLAFGAFAIISVSGLVNLERLRRREGRHLRHSADDEKGSDDTSSEG